jgi:hypothetical protein
MRFVLAELTGYRLGIWAGVQSLALPSLHLRDRCTRLRWPQALELELELIQTHMTQKPMLRVEVGARVCAQVKNM